MMKKYPELKLTEEILSDKHTICGISMVEDGYDIQVDCIDQEAAKKLIETWNNSVIFVYVTKQENREK